MSTPESPIHLHLEGDVAVLTIDNPPVNALSMATRVAVLDMIQRTDAHPAVKAVVIIGAGKTFPAGVDIREFGQALKGPDGRVAFAAVEASLKPVIAALHGTALGGGLELALAAHYRVALNTAKVGLPEVNIGLLPGAGGTQRLTRIIGPEAALDVITSGRQIDARSALELGIVDELIDSSDPTALKNAAIAYARRIVAGQQPLKRIRDRDDRIQNIDPRLFVDFRAKNEKKWKGLVAPQAIVECIEAACFKPWDQAYALEGQRFAEVKASPQRAALSYMFFAEREAAKIPDLSPDIKPKPVTGVAVIGAGTMGGGIAMSFANSDIPVTLIELSQANLERGLAVIKKNYDTSVARGSMSQARADAAFGRISGALSYEAAADRDLVIEAVFENMDVKKQVFTQLDAVMKPGAILATNTSTLDIDQIAEVTRRPEDFVGTHFFSPANVMKLLECVRGAKSSPQTLATAMGLARQLGKVSVLAGNCDGFIGNRILANYGREADFLLEEGAMPWQLDHALKTFGLPMGIFLMRDMAGLDIGWSIRKYREAFRDKSLRYSPIADRICEQGRFGQKTGAGYYRYQGRDATPDPEIETLITTVSKDLGITRKPISDAEIVDRILIAMVNEGARIVGESYAARASDIDVTYVFGYGFPRHEGGPMFWAERRGLDKIYQKVLDYHRTHGKPWEPAPLLALAAKIGSWKAAEEAFRNR